MDASASGGRAHVRRRQRRHHVRIIVIGSLALLVALEGLAISANLLYSERAMPRTSVLGVDVGGMTHSEIARVAASSAPTTIPLDLGTVSIEVPAQEAGISVDVESTANRAIAHNRGSGPLLAMLSSDDVGVNLNADDSALRRWLESGLDGLVVAAKEPSVSLDPQAQRFEVTPGSPGQQVDADALAAQIRAHGISTKAALRATLVPAAPSVSDAEAQAAADRANALVATDFTLRHGDETLARIPRAEVAALLRFETADGELRLSIDATALKARAAQVAAKIDRPMQPQVTIGRGSRAVKVPGLAGLSLTSPAALAGAIGDALAAGKTSASAPVMETTPTARTIADGRREVDVNLTTQRLALKVDGQVIHTYVISSGKPSSPTIEGRFKVWHKTRMQDMRGGSGPTAYLEKDVKWVSFYEGNYAFHTANWHNSFGTPVSHGCVNMREADAKVAYDFAPIGTSVYVHR